MTSFCFFLQAENDSAMTHGEKGESDSTRTGTKLYNVCVYRI